MWWTVPLPASIGQAKNTLFSLQCEMSLMALYGRATHAHNTRANLLLRTSMIHPHPLKLFALLLLSYAALLTGQAMAQVQYPPGLEPTPDPLAPRTNATTFMQAAPPASSYTNTNPYPDPYMEYQGSQGDPNTTSTIPGAAGTAFTVVSPIVNPPGAASILLGHPTNAE